MLYRVSGGVEDVSVSGAFRGDLVDLKGFLRLQTPLMHPWNLLQIIFQPPETASKSLKSPEML